MSITEVLALTLVLMQTQPGTQINSTPITITPGPTITGNPVNTPITLTLTQPPMTPPIIIGRTQATAKGAVLCADHGNSAACKTMDADYVGGYKLNTKCDEGFYDMIHGGTCWKCPDDTDQAGSWIRSADHIEKDTACWRAPKEQFSAATFVKNGWAWDCGSGQFWDSVGQGGSHPFGGACWTCADPYPRRTGSSVTDSKACVRAMNETKPAIFLKYNGCPAPDIKTMYPTRADGDKRMPGKPFLDIASGITVANNAGGACWTCPSADKDGNFIIADRNGNTLINRKTDNSGCTIRFKYAPAPFTEPGLSGLIGVKDIIFEKQIMIRPDAITKYLYALAETSGMASVEAAQWVAQQWADIAAHPYRNDSIRTMLYAYMMRKAPDYMYPTGVKPLSRTAAEAKLVSAFESYAQTKRTYLAQQALDMYDAWKAGNDAWKNSLAQSRLTVMFDYGTVPLDFQGVYGTLLAGGAASVGVIGSLAGAEAIGAGVNWAQATAGSDGFLLPPVRNTLFHIMGGTNILKAGLQAVGVISGASAIAAAGAILSSVAMEQFMAIVTARPRLLSALEKAKQPIKLDDFSNSYMAPFFWSLATGTGAEVEDAQVSQMAQAAYNVAKQKNFVKPQ